MSKQTAFIFDLDGTVVNPGTAIPRCINFALKKVGERTVPIERLKRYIGFPLEDIFADITGKKDKKFLKRCVDCYRERFHKEGIAEHRLYPGIVGLLDAAAKNGTLYITSNKPQVSCEMVLDHLGVKSLFTKVYGLDAAGKKATKTELLKHLIEKEKISKPIVIADRRLDIDAAKNCIYSSISSPRSAMTIGLLIFSFSIRCL